MEARLQAELKRLGNDGADAATKVAAGAPKGAGAAVFDLGAVVIDPDGPPDGHGGGELPPTGIQFTWTERLVGDYDMNGLVGLPDIVPIAAKWALRPAYDSPALHGGFTSWPTGDPDDSSSGAAGPGATNWRIAHVDGDGNGLIALPDITPIAAHWQEALSGYLIEHAVNRGAGVLEWDAQPLNLGSGSFPSVARSTAFPVGATQPDPSRPVRYHVEAPLAETQYAQCWRVRAYDAASGTEGEPSNLVSYVPDPTHDTTPPVWVDTVGVSGLSPYHTQITVQFGVAEDAETPSVTYRVYWAEGDAAQPEAPFDYDTAQYADVAAAPYVITGLTDGLYYRVAVRAADSADPPNRERNTVLRGATVGPRDIYPPQWQGSAGVADLFYGNGMAIVAWGTAVDSHADEYGTWESGPVVYRVYYGEGETPDWGTAQYAEFTDNSQDGYVMKLTGLDTTKTRWFAVRARDQAGLPNEEGNTVFKVGYGISFIEVPVPGLGPGVPAGTEHVGVGQMVYGPQCDQLNYVLRGEESNSKVWLSRYGVGPTGLQHEADIMLAEYEQSLHVGKYFLDAGGKLRALYDKDNTIDQVTISYFREDAATSETYELRSNEDVQGMGFTLDGTPWFVSELWNGELFDSRFNQYFNFWPPQGTEPFWRMWPDGHDETLVTVGAGYAMLNSGAVAVDSEADTGGYPRPDYMITAGRSSGATIEPYTPSELGTYLYTVGGRAVDKPVLVEAVQGSSISPYDPEWYRITDGSAVREVRCDPPLSLSGASFGDPLLGLDCLMLTEGVSSENWIPGDGSKVSFHAVFVVSQGREYRIPVEGSVSLYRSGITQAGLLVLHVQPVSQGGSGRDPDPVFSIATLGS